ncbi:MAG: hypothetical protein P1U58_02905 [Verrucomicrobiales bacterium]|nr:hypothetical protein [Verrucomicrobiales bacterium]
MDFFFKKHGFEFSAASLIGPGAGFFVSLLLALPLQAHKVSSVSLITHLDTKEGTYLFDAAMEVVPSDDDLLNEQIPPEEAAREFAEEYLVTMFDEVEQMPELEITIETASDENTPPELQQKQVLVKMSGYIPEGSGEFLLYLEPTCPMAVVMVVIKDDKPSRRMQVILPGEYSRPVNVLPVMEGDPFDFARPAATNAGESAEESGTSEDASPSNAFVAGWTGFWKATFLPFALTLSIFLITTQRKIVFLQFAAFMIGLSLAVSLAAWKILSMPASMPMITSALLVVLAGECLFHQRFHFWRYFAYFFAGLGAGWLIATLALPRLNIPSGLELSLGRLIIFVTGIELALVVAGLFSAMFYLTMGRFDWYRKTVVTPVAVVLVAFGIFKLVEPIL